MQEYEKSLSYEKSFPFEVRKMAREGVITGPTTGMCSGYAQANLVMLPEEMAYDFLLFCQRNPRSCPLLEVSDCGEYNFPIMGNGCDIRKDIPRYRVYKNGELTDCLTDVTAVVDAYPGKLVSFLIGCSFSFETELLEAGIPVRQIEEGVNVPMYNTNIPCRSAGRFSGNMVVSMRPILIRFSFNTA